MYDVHPEGTWGILNNRRVDLGGGLNEGGPNQIKNHYDVECSQFEVENADFSLKTKSIIQQCSFTLSSTNIK